MEWWNWEEAKLEKAMTDVLSDQIGSFLDHADLAIIGDTLRTVPPIHYITS